MPFLSTTKQLSKPKFLPMFTICPDIIFVSQRKRIWSLCFWRMFFSSWNVRVFPSPRTLQLIIFIASGRAGHQPPPIHLLLLHLRHPPLSTTSMAVNSQLSLNFAEGDFVGLVAESSVNRLIILAFFYLGCPIWPHCSGFWKLRVQLCCFVFYLVPELGFSISTIWALTSLFQSRCLLLPPLSFTGLWDEDWADSLLGPPQFPSPF